MRRYLLSGEADLDLAQIWEFIASDNVSAADEVVQAAIVACDMLAQYPESGRRIPTGRSTGVRLWPVAPYPNYIILYRPQPSHIEILRVLHGKRVKVWNEI